MAIREELTLGIQNFQANLDKARADVRKTAGEMSRDMRNSGGRGGSSGGGILGGLVGPVSVLAPAAAALAAFRIGVDAVSVSMERQRAEMALGAVSVEDVGTQLERLRDLGESPGLGFDQVVAASTKLQAVGISAELAEKSIAEMGNALALVGGGKEQLEGVMTALTQIVSKGTISAEEINQIAERLPQIRRLMQEAFGTADTEALQKMGLGTEEFISGIVDAAAELERATTTSSEAMSNLQDDWKDFMQSIGDTVEPVLKDLFEGLSVLLNLAQGSVKSVYENIVTGAVYALSSITGSDEKTRDYLTARVLGKIDEEGFATSGSGQKKASADQKSADRLATQKEMDAASESARQQEAELRQRERDSERKARQLGEYQSLRYERMSDADQMRTLRDRIAKSLGVSTVTSSDQIQKLAETRAAFGDYDVANAALKDLTELEAIAGRQPGAAGGSVGATGQGSFATLMDQIFGRGVPEQQLEEMRKSSEAVVNSKAILDKILVKMDEPPPKDVFSDSEF